MLIKEIGSFYWICPGILTTLFNKVNCTFESMMKAKIVQITKLMFNEGVMIYMYIHVYA